ncbi:hypothetical protein ACH4XP_36540, partial [Streptomyces griseofuscus]|uniref:hypothetical protein n=1 Tax=Streptomyces griseofuscus TaxID=146922 RepID=UPI0037AA5605
MYASQTAVLAPSAVEVTVPRPAFALTVTVVSPVAAASDGVGLEQDEGALAHEGTPYAWDVCGGTRLQG